MANFPCSCGHLKSEHAHIKYADNMDYSSKPGDECYFILLNGLLCPCSKYAADNLRYLEDVQKEKEAKMLVAVNGCLGSIMHSKVQFFKCQDGTSVYLCEDCGEEFFEYEDQCSGG